MSSAEHPPSLGGAGPKAKKKGKKKKPGSTKLHVNGEDSQNNGLEASHASDKDDGDGNDVDEPTSHTNSPVKESFESVEDAVPSNDKQSRSNGTHQKDSPREKANTSVDIDIGIKLDALAKERDTLRQEVSELRKSLEDIRGKHEQDIAELQGQVEQSETGKAHAETQYRDLLGRVNGIKAQLGERLKADAEEISQAKSQIEDLEDQNRELQESNTSLEEILTKLTKENETHALEVDQLRGRANLSQENWVKERDELISREAYAREEYETAKQAMQDWEVLAMEERSQRESLGEKVLELEDQVSSIKEAYERAAMDRDSQTQTVEGLQRALRDIQDARKKELRELVENSKAQLDEARDQMRVSEEAASSATKELEKVQKDLERALPFEKEVKEKNLLIGKLRHEGVILNDHLTKALRFIKQRNPEDMVDRQVVTNHFLHFLALDRTDAKKFQILQLIAALLAWDDEQKEQAGLTRPGASSASSNLRVTISPFRKTPSTPTLGTDASLMEQRASKESLAELWSDFLEREAQNDGSKRPSTAGGLSERRDSDH